jgi:hypothetical protein
LIVVVLEVFYQMELMIFTSQQRDKMSFDVSDILPLVVFLLPKTSESFIEAADSRRLNLIPKLRDLLDKIMVQADFLQGSIKFFLDRFRSGLYAFGFSLFLRLILFSLFLLLFFLLLC